MEETTEATPQNMDEVLDTGGDPDDTLNVTEEPDLSLESDDSNDDLKLDYTLDSVPAPLRGEVERHVKDIEKQFKSAYTKKTQELATSSKDLNDQMEEYKRNLDQYNQVAIDVLQNPEKYEQYRKLYGFGTQDQTPNAPQINTVEDLLRLNDQRYQQAVVEATQRAEMAADRRLRIQRWNQALETMRVDPSFKKYEKIIVGQLQSEHRYKQLHEKGYTELQLTKQAFEDFKALFREDLDRVKQDTIKSLKTKGRSTTSTPQATKDTAPPSDGKLDREAIIAKVRADLGHDW